MKLIQWISTLIVMSIIPLHAEKLELHSLDHQWMETDDSTSAMIYLPVSTLKADTIEFTAFSSEQDIIADDHLLWGKKHSSPHLSIYSGGKTGPTVITVVATTLSGIKDTTEFNLVVHPPIDTSGIFDGFIDLETNGGASCMMSFKSQAGVERRASQSMEFVFARAFGGLSPESQDTTFTMFSSHPDVIDPSRLVFEDTRWDPRLLIFSGDMSGTSEVGLIGEDDFGNRDTLSYLVTVHAPPAEDGVTSHLSLDQFSQAPDIQYQNQQLTLSDLDTQQVTFITLFNSQGRAVSSHQERSSVIHQDLSHLTPGRYFIQVKQGLNLTSTNLTIR